MLNKLSRDTGHGQLSSLVSLLEKQVKNLFCYTANKIFS